MVCGFVFVSVMSGLHNDILFMFGLPPVLKFDWLPVIEFPWRIMFGTLMTLGIAVCFRTPDEQIAIVRRHLEAAR
jgi:hypothetical protein